MNNHGYVFCFTVGLLYGAFMSFLEPVRGAALLFAAVLVLAVVTLKAVA